MSDENNNQDAFEKLFREKAGDYNIPYNEEDWLKLEKKLDARDAQIAGRRKQWLLIAASFLVFSLLGYFTYDNHNRLNQLSRQLPEDSITEQNQSPIDENDTNLPGDASATEEERGSAGDQEEIADAGTQNVPPVSAGDRAGRQLSETETGDEITGIEYRDTGIILAAGYSITDDSSAVNRVVAGHIREAAALSRSELLQFKPDEEELHETGNEPVLAMNDNDTDNTSVRTVASRAAVSFMASPDLSTAGSISNFYDPGYKIGFSVEYRLTPRLAVSAGAVQSKVRYTAPGKEYDPPPYWNSGIAPDEITGVCLLIDIPVTFKYDVIDFGRSRFFATAGVSSYIMLQEDYRFDYENNPGGLAESWSGDTGTRHWLSNAGFSIGYELDIHPNWSLRAEPFLKVPLKEVGWGNVKLYSIGSFVSVNYKL